MSVDEIDRPAGDQRARLRRELSRFDTVFFLISAMVVLDTIGAIAIGGREVLTWLVVLFVLFVLFFVPSALISAELGAAIPEQGGAYVWVRMAFGRVAGGPTALPYWAGTPLWLGGSLAVVAMSAYEGFIADVDQPGRYALGAVFVALATVAALLPMRCGKWVPTSGAVGARSACCSCSPRASAATRSSTGCTGSPRRTSCRRPRSSSRSFRC